MNGNRTVLHWPTGRRLFHKERRAATLLALPLVIALLGLAMIVW